MEYFDLATYRGNILKRNTSFEDEVINEGVELIYNMATDNFYWNNEESIKYLFMAINDIGKISKEEEEAILRKIESYTFSYHVPDIDGKLYVDSSSLVLVRRSIFEKTEVGMPKAK